MSLPNEQLVIAMAKVVRDIAHRNEEMMLRCHKCDTCYENPDNKTNVFCPECRKQGYTMVGVCHREPVGNDGDRDDLEYMLDLNLVARAEKNLTPEQHALYCERLDKLPHGGKFASATVRGINIAIVWGKTE